MTIDWQPFREELLEWRRHGLAPRLWLRDDDATVPNDDLDRLLALTARHGVPLVLAIVPAQTGEELARRLAYESHSAPAVHGWSHANHAREHEKRAELGAHRVQSVVLDDCARGLARLRALYGDRLLPMLVPPWNRIDAGIAACLPAIGYESLSSFGRDAMIVRKLTIRNAHVDLIDWRGTRRCRDTPSLIARIAAELRLARERDDPWCGILAHHLIDGARQCEFLDRLFSETPSLWHRPI